MQRTKVFAVAAALVAAGAAAILFAGGASAASWHVYQGDMYAGHAYGIQVPANAESIEFGFEGAANGAASIGVYDASGAKLGYYALSPALNAASIANPAAGQYVVYVYDITDGALKVRVNSEKEPALQLAAIDLVREETKLGTFPQGQLDQVITSKLKTDPVFVTLLYTGSSRELDATVASATGNVVTITKESATAFSPGVWTSLKGERAFDAAMLSGNVYTVELHAASFEGSLVLTTLALDLRAPTPTAPAVPTAPKVPAAAPTTASVVEGAPGVFGLETGTAVAFHAPAGKLLLVDPAQLEREAAEEDGERYDYGDDCQPIHGLVTIYAPDDTVLAVVLLDHDNLTAEIDLPVAGEYVAYTHHAEKDIILAAIVGLRAAPELRQLAIEAESFEIGRATLLSQNEPTSIMLTHVPVLMDIAWGSDSMGAFAGAVVYNDKGDVARTDSLLVLGGGTGSPFVWNGAASPEALANYASGEHMVSLNGFYEGSLTVTSSYYLRDQVVEPVVMETEHKEHDHEEDAPAPVPSAPHQLPAAPLVVLPPMLAPGLPL